MPSPIARSGPSVLAKAGAAALAIALSAATAPARAQDFALDTIVVEGASLEAGPVAKDSTGSAVTVVSGAQLRARQIRHAGDALRSLPGVQLNRSGGFANLTQVRIRGAEANHTLVLIDGAEANTASEGEFDFSNLLAEDIARIEVIRGPQSGLYGSNALAGVINIVTNDGRGPARVIVRGEGGSFDTVGTSLSLAGGSDAVHGVLTLQKRTSNGFNISPDGPEDDGSQMAAMSGKGGVRIFDWLKIEGSLRQSVKQGDRDDQIPTLARLGLLQPSEDTPSNFDTRLRMGRLEATVDPFAGRWVHKLQGDFNETKARDDQLPPAFASSALNVSSVRSVGYLSTLRHATPGFLASAHSLTGLIEREQERFTPVLNDNIERQRGREAYAAEYRGNYFDHLTVTANYRQEDNDSFEDFSTYRMAGSLKLGGTGLRLHGGAGTGVKYPTMFEQFGQIPSFGFVPNPDLLPEESFGWDGGVEKTLLSGRLVVDVTYFEADLKNQIDTVFSPTFTAVNLRGTSTRKGVEVSADWRATEALTLGAAYTNLDAFRPDGLREIRRPEHAARFDADYRFAHGRGNLHLAVAYNGAMEDDGLLNRSSFGFPGFVEQRVTLDAFTLVALAASYEIGPGVEMFGRVENLLDENYQEVFGFESAGLAAFAGVRLRLGLAE